MYKNACKNSEGHWYGSTYMAVRCLGHFWAYVGQPHGHIGWAKSMPFASFNPTNPRTNPWNFHKKYWELAILKNELFLSWRIWIFIFEKKIFFASYFWKLATNYVLEWMGLNFDYYDGLQPKMRVAIINEHECI